MFINVNIGIIVVIFCGISFIFEVHAFILVFFNNGMIMCQ